jgi:hypothetical protein
MILLATTTALACSTITTPGTVVVGMISHLTQASFWQAFLISTMVLSVTIPMFLNKIGIHIDVTKLFSWYKPNAKNIQSDLDLCIQASIKTHDDFIKYMFKRDESIKEIYDMNTIHVVDVERETEVLVTKAIQYLDDWFNSVMTTDSDQSPRCKDCKSASFMSTLENIGISLKDQCRIAFKKNGFIDAEGIAFDAYVRNLHSIFRKAIRQSLKQYYIHPSDIDAFFSASPPDPAFERMMGDMYTVFHELISTIKSKELTLIKKIDGIKSDYDAEITTLSLPYTPLVKL